MWLVIGSGSKIWQMLKKNWIFLDTLEVSGKSFSAQSASIEPHYILYVANPPLKILKQHICKIVKDYPNARLVFLSSIVVKIADEGKRYSYVRDKVAKENCVRSVYRFSQARFFFLRPGPIVESSKATHGYPFYTTVDDLHDRIRLIAADEMSDQTDLYSLATTADEIVGYCNFVKFLPFPLVRVLDKFFRLLGKKNYGYTFLLYRKLRGM